MDKFLCTFYLDQTKKEQEVNRNWLIQDYSGLNDYSNENSLKSLYCVTKELNISSLSTKCTIAQVRYFKKWKNSNCFFVFVLLREISHCRRHAWDKKSNFCR